MGEYENGSEPVSGAEETAPETGSDSCAPWVAYREMEPDEPDCN